MAKQPEETKRSDQRSGRKQPDSREARRRGPLGCLLAPILYPFRVVFRQVRFLAVVLVITFGACAACAIFAPAAFQSIIDFVRSAGLNTYVVVLRITGNPALKLITYEANVTGYGRVERDMGLLGLAFGQGAEVLGNVRIGLGADIERQQFGILTCEIDTGSIRTRTGSAPLAGFAFDLEQIEQEAYRAFKEEAARQAIEKYWPEARKRLQDQFVSWALGLTAPEQPDLTSCPQNLTPTQTPTG